MPVNYTAIADHVDANGWQDYETAFAAMAAETTTHTKAEARYNELDLMRELGMATAGAVLDKLEQALPARVVRAIQGAGIDLVHAETSAVLDSLVPAVLTTEERSALSGLTVEIVSTWPGLRAGHVQNAMQMRASGEI
jgi:hypothetical protein